MLEKRDLQLVRLAVRRQWLQPEEGEDCLHLKRKFDEKYSIEEIIRRRGYLHDDAIAELTEATEALLQRAERGLFRRSARIVRERASVPPRPKPRGSVPVAPMSVDYSNTLDMNPRRASDDDSTLGEEDEWADHTVLDSSVLHQVLQNIAQSQQGPTVSIPPRGLSELVRASVPPPASDPAGPTEPGLIDQTLRPPIQPGMVPRPVPVAPSLRGDPTVRVPTADPTIPKARKVSRPSIRPPSREGSVPRPDLVSDLGSEDETMVVDARVMSDLREALKAREASKMRAPSVPTPRPPSELFSPPSDTMLDSEWEAGQPLERVDGDTAPQPQVFTPSSEPPPVIPTDYRLSQPPSGLEIDALLSADFGPYQIQRLIARGRTGDVYLAHHADTEASVALRLVKPSVLRHAGGLTRFLEDYQKASQVESPNVLRIYEVGSVGPQYYVAMEYVEGWPLRDRLADSEPLTLLDRLQIVRGLASALEDISKHGLVHQSVEPDCVMVRSDGTALLTGFGLSPYEPEHADAPAPAAHPKYAAPEVLRGQPADRRSDVYGLGLVLYEILTEEPLFSGGAETIREQRLSQPGIPELKHSALVEPVRRFLLKLLVEDPARRLVGPELTETLDRVIRDVRRAKSGKPAASEEVSSVAVLLRALALWVPLIPALILFPPLLEAAGWLRSDPSGALLRIAILGTFAVGLGLGLLVTLGLVRRGQLPLPGSTTWLVTIEDVAGIGGTALLVSGLALGPPAVMNLLVSAIAALVLGSWVFGVLLRRSIARARADGGEGRMLVVLGDVRLRTWRLVHGPILTMLAFLATVRFAFLAYFSAS